MYDHDFHTLEGQQVNSEQEAVSAFKWVMKFTYYWSFFKALE